MSQPAAGLRFRAAREWRDTCGPVCSLCGAERGDAGQGAGTARVETRCAAVCSGEADDRDR